MTVQFPYGKDRIPFDFEGKNLSAVITSKIHGYKPSIGQEELVRKALREPVGSEPLSALAAGKKTIVIIASDHTRPVPSKVILPPMLEELRRGAPDAEITLLIATGCHRGTTKDELIAKFGEEIVKNERIVIHDCDDTASLVHIGTLPSGGECVINRLAVEADLLVSEGFIEPHFFAGFSGGRKSILPGIASRTTVLANHCSEFIADKSARTGILEGNPIHRDMLWAAEKARLAFIVNVALNADKEVIYAVAGAAKEAHEAGCRFVSSLFEAEAVPADIVISTNGGYPLDQNVYQSVKGMTAAEATVKEGGVIIMLASAIDGHGGQSFYDQLAAGDDLEAIERGFLSHGRNETVPDQWEAQILVRILRKARVVYVSDAPDGMITAMHMIPAHSLPEALKIAEELSGKDAPSITAIPDGVSVIIR